MAFVLSNINADFLQLILAMAVSHYYLGTPIYGAALFMLASIWILYFAANLRKLSDGNRSTPVMWGLLSLSILTGLALIFLWPLMTDRPGANMVSFFVTLLAARSLLSWKVNSSLSSPGLRHRIYKGLYQLLFLLPLAGFAFLYMDGGASWFVAAGCAVTGVLVSFQSSTLASLGKFVANNAHRRKLDGIASYRVFANMTLYAHTALCLGILVYLCYIGFSTAVFSTATYIAAAAWLVMVLVISDLTTRLVDRNGTAVSVNTFILGAALWTAGSITMVHGHGFWNITLWTCLWGTGLACITSVFDRSQKDFKLVALIADRKVSDRDLRFRSMLTRIIAAIISDTVMLGILTVWVFVIPAERSLHAPEIFRRVVIQLPVLFMIVSVLFALRQPLDTRSRQKLVKYTDGEKPDMPTKQNLRKNLVERRRVRFGVKIIAFFVKPFLRLRVVGAENMDKENFPSIFVCNHGIIYGPVAAVIYLPTYFRPWIDHKMVDHDMAAREMYSRFIYRIPLLGEKAGRRFAHWLAGPVTWALNSFNPIPVEKTALRKVMTTFDDTVKVLGESDNVLIFPEKPRRVKRGNKDTVEHLTDSVGTLFTGFANIGSLYYEATGRQLRFYPIYASRRKHTFTIGEPVIYDPDGDQVEEKRRIASLLHDSMLKMSE